LCQFQHDSNKISEENEIPENPKGFTIVKKKVVYKCATCDFRENDVEAVRKHTNEKHTGHKDGKEMVNETDSDNNGDTLEIEDNIGNEDTDDEDVHDSVTAYLKEYRKKKIESEKVSASGGPRAHTPGFHKL
jgi:hypothetical protein